MFFSFHAKKQPTLHHLESTKLVHHKYIINECVLNENMYYHYFNIMIVSVEFEMNKSN